MEYRSLGGGGVQLSRFGLGCLNFGRDTEPEDMWAIIDRALDAGGPATAAGRTP